MLRLKIKIQSDKENVELDFLSLRRMIWGLLNVLILKKIWFAYFTNFWKIVCFPSLLSGLSLLKVLLPLKVFSNQSQLGKGSPLQHMAHQMVKAYNLTQKCLLY